MTTPWLYRVAAGVVRLALSIYFRKLEITGRRHVPAAGPAVYAANHPQSITDALVLGAAVADTVHYLAHSGLFRPALRAWLLRQCAVIPIYRRHDATDAAEHNVRTFAACTELLTAGGAIGIFPEGTSQEERRVQKIHTGAARIALEAEEAHDFTLGVCLVPVGINFESRARFRSRVLVSFGHPLWARDYRDLYRRDSYEAVHALTADLAAAIRARVVNLERSELDELVHNVERTYQEHLLDQHRQDLHGETRFQRQQTVSREIARAVNHFYDEDPETVWKLDLQLREYRERLHRLRISDEMIREGKDPTLRRRFLRLMLLALLGLPVGAYGLLTSYLPYRTTEWIAKRMASDSTKVHTVQIMVGTGVCLIYYPLMVLTVRWMLRLSDVQTMIFVASLVPTALLARVYVRLLVRERRMIHYAYVIATHRAAIQQLRRLRGAVIGQMDELRHRYLASRDASAGAGPHGPHGPHGEAL